MLQIVADGSVDMPEGWESEYDIHVVPMPIQIGSKTYFQGLDLAPGKFYELVRQTGLVPKTSLPSPAQLVSFYQKVAHPGETVLSLHVSSKMSGTFASAVTAAKELAGRYKILPFDSGCGSAGLGFMCREARLLERAGASLQGILDRLGFIRSNISIILTLDTLEFARRSGRVGALQAALASLLSIKPVIVLRDGILNMADRVRTRGRSLDQVLEIARQRAGERLVNVAVVHCCDPEAGVRLKERVQSLLHCKEVVLSELSISVAANLGPGTVGVVVYPVE